MTIMATNNNIISNDQHFSSSQFIDRPIDEVFSFFSEAKNLEVLTPPWLGFRIQTMSSKEIQENTLIDYRLKIHGVPVGWRTLIKSWSPPNKFVDTQLKGPYSKWHHTHTFESVGGGTQMHDEVIYRLPLGKFGNFFVGRFVKKEIQMIFDFRREKIKQIFQIVALGAPT
jgi:ligand-binding SRPBCC domain-containing protein